MKIFTGEQPKNPCEGCEFVEALCPVPKSVCQEYREYQGQLSILSQCVEVGDIDELYHKYNAYRAVIASGGKCCVNYDSFSQFVQSEITSTKQEATNAKNS